MWRCGLALGLVLGAIGCDDGATGADSGALDLGADRGLADAGLDASGDRGVGDARIGDARVADAGADARNEDGATLDGPALDARADSSVDDAGRDQAVGDGSPDDAQDPDAGPPGACGEPATTEPVCGGLCGDGVRTTCQQLVPNRPPPPFDAGVPEVTEACDGDDHGGATCGSLGYVGGDLECDETCAFDRTGCQFCVPGPRVSACRLAADDFVPEAFSLALGDRVAVAWVGRSQQGFSGFFSTFARDTLEPISTRCLGAGVTSVAVASAGDGFMVATGDVQTREIELTRLTAAGEAAGAGPGAQGVRVSLHAVADGTLMVWTDNANASSARLIDGDGEAVWTTRLFDSELGRASVVEVPGGYLVAQRSSVARDGGRHNGVVVARLADDGELLGYAFPARPSTEYPALARDGDQIRLTFADFGAAPRLYWAALSARGEALSEALLGERDAFNPAPAAVVGDATYVLQGQYTGTTDHAAQLRLRRVDAAGRADPGLVLNQSGVRSVFWQLVPADDDFIVGWIEAGVGLGLARVTQ